MNCFVYQKHIDLHAVSALEAIHGFMNLGHCKGLTRFGCRAARYARAPQKAAADSIQSSSRVDVESKSNISADRA